ncbi:uncharacterized protein LOC121899402 [Scomber scombrus]|uniref:Uncharacterized protein LOC121899402 n=1 Tax=Scomber scombrus TaxID=13677 RepID=A0AAV1N3M0_SCOSC
MHSSHLQPFHHFQFVKNVSSKSFDLLILNITSSDAGLYYCGTEETRVEDKEYIKQKNVYGYSNVITRILVDSTERHCETPPVCVSSWILMFSLCPTFAIFSSVLSSLLVYHLSHKTAKEPEVAEQTPDTRGQTRLNQVICSSLFILVCGVLLFHTTLIHSILIFAHK